MPDKSKRRRNNKNKRKNKTNRAETCHNEIDGKELVSQQLEEQISEPEYENRNNATNSESAQQNIIPEIIDNAQEVSQDLNNNTNNDQISDNTIPLNQEFISTKLSLAHDSASNQESLAYVVEVPEQKVKNKSKLTNTVKSKSLDNDDAPKIVEITEDNRYQIEESNVNPIIDYSNVVIYDSESDVEWEKIDEFENTNIPFSKEVAKEIISITTLPLDVAHCEETKTLTPEEEVSLRNYLKTLQLSTTPDNIHSLEIKTKIEQIINQEVKHRLRKKGSADDFFIQRLGLPRVLDVIDEEASGESSSTSRRQSYLSDKKSDIEDLEDDVFENKNTIKDKFSTKSISSLRNKPLGQLVQQECLLVGAKLKEPEVSEARGNWTMKTVEKMAGAEVVYLTDSSSSTSSLHEIEEDTDDGIETDVSIRMVTPTIEVTDTENLLKKTFVSCKDDYSMPGCNNLKQSVKVDSSLSEIKNPKEITHEIVVLSTDDIKTNLYVKDLDDCINNDLNIKHDSIMEKISTDSVNDDNATQNNSKKFDLEIKVIKCELNDAFNNLIKEVTSDSEITTEDSEDIKEKNDNNNYTRQDSSSSVSSQCTAKYNPNYSSLNDVSNIQHDEICQNILLDAGNTQSTTNASSHVQDVINSLAGPIEEKKNKRKNNVKQPFTLKDFCIRKIASLPYGDKVLEELASVSARLQNIRESTVNKTNHETNQIRKENISYYHLDPVSSIENIPLSIQTRDIVPPPIKPRNSSLKKSQDEEHWTGVATNTEPVYVCLSPSQKMLIEKTNTVSSNDDKLDLINMPNKFIDRRVHYETNNESTTKTRSKLVDVPEISPVLKSQTGSRLLALICDPSITTNVNSLKNRSHNSLEQLQKDHVGTENISENKIEITNINRDFSRPLRPVPLPKPRKFSTSIYESDESSDFTENSLRSTRNEKKVFHFSTGNLNKEIENDISSIQNLHRFHTDIRHNVSSYNVPRRPSLPKDLCDQQMEYIRRKEKEVDAEIQRLEEMKNSFYKAAQRKGPRAPLVTEKDIVNEDIKSTNNYFISHKRDIVMSKHGSNSENREKNPTSLLFNNQEEVQREKMYSEFATQIAEREERKQQKVIKITNPSTTLKAISKSLPTLDILDSKVNNRIEKEFISKARERWEKLGIRDPETEDERESDKNMYNESKIIEHKIKVIEDGKERDVQRLPSHLQEFVRFTAKGNAESNNSAVWRPGAPSPPPVPAPSVARSPGAPPPPPPPPVWVPGSAGASPQATRKTFRPVHFEETPPSRRKFGSSEQNGCTSGSESEGRLKTSHSAPLTGLSTLGSPSVSSRLPRAPNPTVTLLQKAREGQIPRGTSYLQSDRDSARLPRDRPSPPRGDPVHALRKEYASETEVDRSGYESGGSRKMADAQKKVEGIGPTTKDGIPITLRSEVKDPSRWYKKMYDTIHKNKYDDDYVTIRYKNRRGHPERVISNKSQYAYFDPRSGYLSEPEGGLSRLGSSTWSEAYDSDVATGPRRRTASVQEDRRSDVTSTYLSSNKYSTLASARASQEMYKNQPGRIEDYVPGRSSVIDKEAKQWWDEVMDIFDGQNITSTTSLPQASPKEKKDITSAILSKSNMAKALKESGYESDSTLIFRRREDTEAPLSPAERRAAYKDLQAGGEPPLRGFRSPAPPRQDESEIEYIPISSTLTKIRIHKKTPNLHEVICYPITKIEPDMRAKRTESTFHFEEPSLVIECPPAPPRRISSKNSKTLRLVTSTTPLLSSTTRPLNQSQTNVDYLRSKINNKLTRQNTHIIISKECDKNKIHKYGQFRVTSSSAPPAVDRKNALTDKTKSKNTISTKTQSTSSFASSRKMLLPIEYSNSVHSRYGVPSTSRVIERGAGRRTPISNILDKVTSLDKLWSAEKRNEQIDITKASKSVSRSNHCSQNKSFSIKPDENVKSFSHNITHKSRDMVRTAEKLQKMKISNHHTKSSPCLATRNDQKNNKPGNLQTASKISKSSLNVSSGVKKQNQIKTAVVTNLNKKKTIENVVPRPQVSPCHETCSKKPKDLYKNTRIKNIKSKLPKKSGKSLGLEVSNQFGGSSKDTSNSGSLEKLYRREKIYTKEIKQAVVSDSFFQHLFFGKTCDQIVAYPLYEQNTTVLQKAKMFQSLPNDNNTPKLQNSYLIHRKPVSLSCFKIWDRHRSPNQAHSPRSVSWPGRIHSEIRKFDSLTNHENFGSTSSLATVRSKSEPPINKIYFSQTSRPKSPVVLFYNKEITPEVNTTYSLSSTVQKGIKTPPQISCYKPLCGVMKQSLSPTKLILTETTRPVSPNLMNRLPNLEIRKKVINDNISPSTILFFQTSSDDSPKINIKPVLKNKSSRSNSTSPLPTRSPSCRRIHSVRLQSGKYYDEAPKIITRTRSAGDADNRLLFQDNMQLLKTKSDSNLNVTDPDYDEYIRDMQNSKARSERFRELNRYYTYLERVGELERATSTCDVRHRRKDEEIVDFDRWKKIRAIERAEEELNNLYRKLKIAQDENDVLFYPRDVKDFRWNYDRERGLRIKERSVENLKDHFQQLSQFDSLELEQIPSKDTYKPLWRGTSVAETAFHINKLNEQKNNHTHLKFKPTVTLQSETSLYNLQKKIGLGNRLWSSLSMDQVNALKNQLNAIYSKECGTKLNEKKECDFYTVDVSGLKSATQNPSLHVRCNSLVTTNYTSDQEKPIKLSKSESIAAMPCPITSMKELKNNVNKIQMSLSENEKRKISQTLSKELLNKINKCDNENKQLIKQQIDDSKVKEYDKHNKNVLFTNQHFDVTEKPCTGNENIWHDKQRHVVYPNENVEIQNQSSASETETASSDVSNKTTIYRGPSKEVKKKVEYFESVKNITDSSKTIYQAKENINEKENKLLEDKNVSYRNGKPGLQINQIVQSQSCTNIKEFFGESEKNKFLSLPVKPEFQSRSISPHSMLDIVDRETPDTLRFSSDETIWRSRSPSPDPERYWRAYLNLAQRGDVRRLVRRFDSPTTVGTILHRHRSDPEIARNVLNKNWSFLEKLSPQRDKCKAMLPVARVPLRTTNRFMPHIDIISKLASLRRRITPRSRSAEEALECRPGEVNRIRRRFEAMSLLGHVYTSAPDVTELHDIAPYLAGSWVAHRYPKPSDNNKSIKDPSSPVHGQTSSIKKDEILSTPKEPVKLSSILKIEAIRKEGFDPSLHRPVSRYEPPRAPPRPPPTSWPQRLSPYVTSSRHTVTFQETNSVPEPPRRSLHGSYSDTESPRRYVESDVNIHYRCPVRHDPLPLVPERELARQQAEHMKRLYREQRRTKYLQDYKIRHTDIDLFDASMKELQDMQNRRHQDNFTPSQKTVVPLNRYDEADKVTARALYTFNGQTPRELSFRKGEIIYVRRQIDANWYEGEVHGKIGLFPYNYVEIQKSDTVQPPKKPTTVEGRARAKFDFIAQTNLELPLKKGEVVVLSRRIDQNWWEGRNGVKTGIFPDSYVTVLQEPTQGKPEPKPILSTDKPVASPAAHGLLNGTDKRSMGSHSYTPQPNSPALANAPPATQPLPGYVAKPAQATLTPSDRGYGPPTGPGVDLNNAEPLYVDTNAEAVPYRAMYKYRPQNPDELELQEGDTVYVLEKCDDGWYVGSSQRTGRFGTFPGNYVERI